MICRPLRGWIPRTQNARICALSSTFALATLAQAQLSSITAPSSGALYLESDTFPISAEASDPGGVSEVHLLQASEGVDRLILSDSGAAQLLAGSAIIWSSDGDTSETVPNPSSINGLQTNEGIYTDEEILSPNGNYRLILQGDGNLVIYDLVNGGAPWASGTQGTNTDWLILQGDGNLVLRDSTSGDATWASGTNGLSDEILIATDDEEPYTFDVSGLTAGNYDFFARAITANGTEIDSDPVNIDIVNYYNEILSPEEGATFTDVESFAIEGRAEDADGVSAVELWVNGALYQSLTAGPYEWTIGQLDEGLYEFVIRIVDANGDFSDSEALLVTITADDGTGNGTFPSVGSTIVLTAKVNNKYVSANNPNSELIANAEQITEMEMFEVVDSGIPPYVGFLNLGTGQFVRADEAGNASLKANGAALNSYERFKFEEDQNQLGILADINDLYVKAESAGDGPLIASNPFIAEWEDFSFYEVAAPNDAFPPVGAVVAFISSENGLYVSADNPDNELIANADTLTNYEKFEVVADGFFVGFRCIGNDQFVAADEAGGASLKANRPSLGSYEQFSFAPGIESNEFGFLANINGQYVTAGTGGSTALIASSVDIDNTGSFTFESNFPQEPTYELLVDESITQGERILSPNEAYNLVLQGDGNLVLYESTTGAAFWASNTNGTQGDNLVLQGDGNLVLYNTTGGSAEWSSGTTDQGVQKLIITDDGVARLMAGTAIRWASDGNITPPAKTTLFTDEELLIGETIESSDGAYSFGIGTNGNLTLTELATATVLWSTGSTSGDRLILQGDGNLVLLDSGNTPIWSTETNNTSANRLIITNEGVARLMSGGSWLWASDGYLPPFDFGCGDIVTTPELPIDQSKLDGGPMVGHTTDSSAMIWVQPKNTNDVKVYYRAENGTTTRSYVMNKQEGDDVSYRATIECLSPETRYEYDVVVDNNRIIGSGSFKTAPVESTPGKFTFTYTSCGNYSLDSNQVGWNYMRELADPSFVLYLGDTMYTTATRLNDYLWAYRQSKTIPSLSEVLRNYPFYTCWDDHDYGGNDTDMSWPGREAARNAFRDAWANPFHEDNVYYNFKWGEVEFFVLDNRYHRTTHWNRGDSKMFGDAQMDWLKAGLSASTAKFKVICQGNGYNGGEANGEGFSGYPSEFQGLRNHIIENSIDGVVHMSGDVHLNVIRMNQTPHQNFGYTVYDFMSSGIGRGNGLSKWARVDVDTTISDPTFTVTYYENGTNADTWSPGPAHYYYIPIVKSFTVRLSELQN